MTAVEILSAVRTLHEPVMQGTFPFAVCDGCPSDSEYGAETWPCSTATIVYDAAERSVVAADVEKAEAAHAEAQKQRHAAYEAYIASGEASPDEVRAHEFREAMSDYMQQTFLRGIVLRP